MLTPPPSEAKAFYDALAPYYDLIYEDWEASMQRQGAAIASILRHEFREQTPALTVLDVAAGIGTQSLPLAKLGCRVFSRDVSAGAISRLSREAQQRGLVVDSATGDMRAADATLDTTVDVVLAFDNAIPHLLSDDEILSTFRSFLRALRPGGFCLISVRDYETISRESEVLKPYGVRWRDGVRHVLFQVWRWLSTDHYEVTFYVLVDEPRGARTLRTTARYYAVTISRLLELMSEAGFIHCRRIDNLTFQPVLVAEAPTTAAG